jgi:predicted nucleic acid-binding protein/uncharacterized protein with PIN domain
MAVIYIDTNVFLDFYQASTDRLAVFEDILKRSKSVLLTQQTVNEFRRNRIARLTTLADHIKKGPHPQLYTTAVVQALPGFEEWVKARDAAKKAAHEIANELISWVMKEESDPVLAAFEKLVRSAKVIAFDDPLIERARRRKLLGQPPTSPDKHTIGDELIWESLLTWKDDDLVVVTRDKSFLDNRAILKGEYESATGKRLIELTESLAAGLKATGQKAEKIEEAEKKLPRSFDDEPFPANGKCLRCNGELEESGYEGSDGDEAWWLFCTKCGHEYFPRAR